MPIDKSQSAPPQPAAAGYTRAAIGLHWTIFTLVVIVGTLGLLHDSWPRAAQAYWINVHALVGLLLWAVLMVRIFWRARHTPPELPASVGLLQRRLSTAVHLALYALLFVIPIIGVVTFVYHGRIFDFGLFQIDTGIKSNRAIFHPTEDIHGYLAYALFALAGLHAVAALWHQFVLHDAVLVRMWPRLKRQ
jgi:cytochrome b561